MAEPESKRLKASHFNKEDQEDDDVGQLKNENESMSVGQEAEEEGKVVLEEQEVEIPNEFSHVVEDKPLWLEILRYLDRDMLDMMDEMPELRGLGLLVKAERKTVGILNEIRRDKNDVKGEVYLNAGSSGYQLLNVDCSHLNLVQAVESGGRKDFLYEWGADKAGFYSKANFTKFCKYAGVDPLNGRIEWRQKKIDSFSSGITLFNFVSDDKKVVFSCSNDPTSPDNKEAYVHYFGITGNRDRLKWLASWFKDNCYWEEICYGDRGFC